MTTISTSCAILEQSIKETLTRLGVTDIENYQDMIASTISCAHAGSEVTIVVSEEEVIFQYYAEESIVTQMTQETHDFEIIIGNKINNSQEIKIRKIRKTFPKNFTYAPNTAETPPQEPEPEPEQKPDNNLSVFGFSLPFTKKQLLIGSAIAAAGVCTIYAFGKLGKKR